jgi:hypothetical protein
MAMAGELSEPARISDAVEAFWTGVEEWSSERNLLVDEQLDDLLQDEPQPREPTIDREQAASFVRANGSQLERLRLQRAFGESFTLAEAEAVLRPYQLVDGSFDYQIREDERERVGSLGATLHCLRWVREFGLGNRSQMVRTLDFLASAQAPDGSFYETEKKLAHSPQDWLTPDAHVDRFLFTAAVPMRLFSLGYSQHPMIQPALRWLKRYWLDWELITHTHFNLWALLCLSRSPIGLSGSVYQRYYAIALDWLPELDAQPLTWMLDALQGAGFTADEPLVAQGLARLSSLQSESGAWPDPRTPAETTVTALRLLHDYGFATH